MRHDLLALTPDDLVLLANRGLVKRAQQELLAGDLRCTLDEDAQGSITAHWSDGIECVLPGGKPVSLGRCTCPATSMCRHLLRSVLAYQRQVAESQQQYAAEQLPRPWDPGAISDDDLAQHLARGVLAWARQAFEAGQVIELVRSAKPSAYFHTLACSVRFLVPGDLRYTHCDCAEPAPCRHVPLAVLAYRILHPERQSGIVETATQPAPAPVPLLDEIDAALRELVAVGIGGAPQALIERLRRLERRCRDEGLIWPADALADLAHQHAVYIAHDARFSPAALAGLIGELCIRGDAIRANTGAVPQLFVRGAAANRETAVGTARLIGLGCGVRVRRGGVEPSAYLQDADTGALMVVRRDEDESPAQAEQAAPFWQLAQRPIAKGAGIAALGAGQALVKGGRRLPNGQFVPARAQIALNPQAYAWESLRPPALVQDFGEIAARLAAQPPAALRPRRLTDGLYVCAVTGAETAAFVPSEQVVRATLHDTHGDQATLLHPYTTRGHSGVEALLALLQGKPRDLRFVAGHVLLSAHGLTIAPTALVFQDGATRRAVLPWVAREEQRGVTVTSQGNTGSASRGDALAEYWAQVSAALGDLLVVGLGRADERIARRWRELARVGGTLGFGRSLQPIEHLAAELAQKAHTLRWEAERAAEAVLELACVTLLAGDALSMNAG